MLYLLNHLLAHAFGARYELPIPLALFVFGGAGIVLLSFFLVLPRRVTAQPGLEQPAAAGLRQNRLFGGLSILFFTLFALCGIYGVQEQPENIVPTLFWLVAWIAVPLFCGLIGDWTKQLNPFAVIARLASSSRLRHSLIVRTEPFRWPTWLGWWPAVIAFLAIASGELIYNQTATLPAVTAACLLVYFFISAFCGLLYGQQWLEHGEVFSVLYRTWGRLGYFRFGGAGSRGWAGGLYVPFESHPSRIAFTLLLLISVSFDGLLATPLWSRYVHSLPASLANGSTGYKLTATAIFVGLALVFWLVFFGLATAVRKVGKLSTGTNQVLASLLPSLIPISFGYLLAHNLEYLMVNGQLLFPLIGNPTGQDSWPLHLHFPFNDSYEPNIHLLPSSAYWYISLAVIVVVHIMAIFIAHRYLAASSRNTVDARRAEYPWIIAMVCYTMLSLWLLAQPLVKEHDPSSYHRNIPAAHNIAYKKP